jgi:2-polyprenyl-6-methoxyphenol hydroxylase-like FAD-dependent oxidoreductase
MRISCVGGGPAGLYFAILMKQRDSDHEITVFEREPAGLTYGWGGNPPGIGAFPRGPWLSDPMGLAPALQDALQPRPSPSWLHNFLTIR